MEMERTVNSKRKWAEVDRVVDMINERIANGEAPCQSPFEEYIHANFNK